MTTVSRHGASRASAGGRGGRISGAVSITPPGWIAGNRDCAQRTTCTAGLFSSSFGGGRPPDDLIHEVVRTIGGAGDAGALEVERRVVAIVIAAPAHRPVQHARADIHDLRAVVDERVAGDRVALGAGGEMHADPAALEPVAGKAVLVGVVDEHAFVAAADDVVLDARIVGVVEQHAMIAVAVGDVADQRQPIRIHHGVADVVADGNVVGDGRCRWCT